MKLLLIEDELKTSQTIKQGLEENGYSVETAYDGETGLNMALSNKYNLIITDIMIPKINGLDICKRLRIIDSKTPVIMLTALGMTSDKIKGFEMGTDDYIVKPFEFAELIARVRALLKRSESNNSINNIMSFADITVNLDNMEVVRSGKQIKLTAKEFGLLIYFIKNKGRVVSKSDIAEHVWDIHFDTGTNIVEVYVNYLRNKIDKDFKTKLIHTRIGMGYVLRTED
jgi:two-component system copper resistance phosphate regulon response regulator CusR